MACPGYCTRLFRALTILLLIAQIALGVAKPTTRAASSILARNRTVPDYVTRHGMRLRCWLSSIPRQETNIWKLPSSGFTPKIHFDRQIFSSMSATQRR